MKTSIKKIVVIALALTIAFAFLPDLGMSKSYAMETLDGGEYPASQLNSLYGGAKLFVNDSMKITLDEDLDLCGLMVEGDLTVVNQGSTVHEFRIKDGNAQLSAYNIYLDGVTLIVSHEVSEDDTIAIFVDDDFIVNNSVISITSIKGTLLGGNFELTDSSYFMTSYFENGEGVKLDKKPMTIRNSEVYINMLGSDSYGIKSAGGDINYENSEGRINAEYANSFPIYGKGKVVFSKSDMELNGEKAACVAPTAGITIKPNNYIKVPSKGDVVKYNINFDTIGDPNGKIAKKVTISKKYLSDKACTVYAPNKVYTGDRIRPIVVRWNGNKITKDKSYKVSYSNNLNVGKAKVTIKGIGNFTGKVVKYFKIIPKGTTLLKPEPLSKAVRVKWKIQKARMSKTHITGYKIKVATNKSFTKNVKTVTVKGYSKVSRRIKNLKAKKKYYVKIRTYKVINGKYYNSKWSAYKTFTTKG